MGPGFPGTSPRKSGESYAEMALIARGKSLKVQGGYIRGDD